MKIIFLCGTLEPGRDGVGDYTRRLAVELIREGHQAAIVAINDLGLSNELDGPQESEGISIPVLRIPSHWQPAMRFQRAGLWIEDFNPEWLSLQFVPFSFHPRGLPAGIGNMLARIGKGKRWHIMVHELWVGMDKESPLKFVFWGWLQKQLIKSLFLKLKPEVIHTQTTLYMQLLKKIGFKPQHLPLFGNISVAPVAGKINGHQITVNKICKTISFVVFGGIHAGVPIGQFAKELKLYGENNGIRVVLKMIGRCGAEQFRWQKECNEVGLPVELLGEQSAKDISDILSNASFGICTTPASLIEKSGSVAALREHGLTILCIARSWHPRGISSPGLPEGVVLYKPGEIQHFVTGPHRYLVANSITVTARQFINNLLLPV